MSNTEAAGYIFFMFFLLAMDQIRVISQGRRSMSWPTTEGVIIRSYVSFDPGGDSSETYGPRVGFKYTVLGKEYENYEISYKQEPETNDKGSAEEVIARYPNGKAVKVYYLPKNPQISVLEPGLGDGWPFLVLLLESVVFIVAGIWAVATWSGFAPEHLQYVKNIINLVY